MDQAIETTIVGSLIKTDVNLELDASSNIHVFIAMEFNF